MRDLLKALDFKVSELIGFDLLLAAGGAAGGSLLEVNRPDLALVGLPVLAGLVGVVIGAVVAGIAIQVAFMDPAFLVRVRQLDRDPVYYLAPLLFTAVVGILAGIGTVILAFSTPTADVTFRGVTGGFVGFLSLYTLGSLLRGLNTLVQFIGLKADAAGLEVNPPVTLPQRPEQQRRA